MVCLLPALPGTSQTVRPVATRAEAGGTCWSAEADPGDHLQAPRLPLGSCKCKILFAAILVSPWWWGRRVECDAMLFLLLLLLVLLVATAFFSGAETALFSLRRYDVSQLRRSARPSQRLVAQLLEQPRRVLLTLMIGNVTINLFIFATSLALFEQLPAQYVFLAPILGLISPVILTLAGDILPKGVAILMGRKLAIRAAPVIRGLDVLLSPVRLLLDALVTPLTRLLAGGTRSPAHLSVEELRELIQMSERRRVIDADENAMLGEVVQLGRLKVRNVMVPRMDMIAFEVHDDVDQLRLLLRERGFAKLPIYDGSIDRTIGLAYAKDVFLNRGAPLRQLLRPVQFVPEIISLTQLLAHFRRTKTQLAIVVDEYGGVVGVVTVEDVASEIVGELDAEEVPQPAWEQLDERHYRVSGDVDVREWAEQFKVRRTDEWVTTLGGLIITQLGRPAEAGDQVRIGNLVLTVESLRGRRIERVLIELADGSAGPVEAANPLPEDRP